MESDSCKNMTSPQASCLLCLSMNKNTLSLYTGTELDIIRILSIHFWFTIDEINVLPNICYECLKKIESFHEFYESVQTAHKKFEKLFVKVGNELDIEDDGERYQSEQMLQAKIKIENDLDIEDEEETYLWEEVTHDKIKTENEVDFEDERETYQSTQVPHDKIKIEYIQDEKDESSNSSVWECPCIDSTRAFDLLPIATQSTYLKSYKAFLAWISNENISDEECFSKAALLKYFYYLKTKNKPTTLRAHYSMLRTTIQRNNNVDICYPEVASFLKENAVGFRTQKNIFQPDELQRFFLEAKDSEFLAMKVIMIFLINGVTRTNDLVKVGVNDVCEQGSVFVIKIPDSKTNSFRSFIVENEYAACVQKYKKLRPAHVTFDRFFIKYQKGKCVAQPIGKNKFSNAPKIIANFLNLKNPEIYTCHSFCKDSISSNKRTINSEKINFERSSEAMVTSAITSSIDSPTSTIPSTVTENNSCENAGSFDILPETSPEQCADFRPDEIQRFLCEAEDNTFLAVKVIMIFAIYGITKADDLLKLDVNDVIEHGSVFVIKIPDTKTNGLRSITVQNYEYAAYVQKYIELRPENISHSQFFINYKEGKCTAQPISKKKLHSAPKVIANFLNLKDAENYSLLSFHKKSLKRVMLLSSVLDNYTEDCIPNKKKTSELNSKQIKFEGSTQQIVKATIASTISTTPNFYATTWDLLPGKTREKYIRSYDNFMAWKADENIDEECFSETVMLKYFNYLKRKYKPTTLWSEYSKLKTTIQKNYKNIDINYPVLKSFLRTTSFGYQPQKCNLFQPNEILRFLSEADDKEFLVVKVIMIFGIYGVSKADELTKLETKDVIQQKSEFVIKITDSKTNDIRSVCVENVYLPYVQKYKELRPENVSHSRFFINYQKGKCTVQPIGKNTFAHMPKVIAKFLNLQDVENYTLKSFC